MAETPLPVHKGAVREVTAPDAAALDALLAQETTPFVVRALAAHWPLVQAGRDGAAAARAHLAAHARPRAFTVSLAGPQAGGRLFYDPAMQVNFQTVQEPLTAIWARFDAAEQTADGRLVYMGSIDIPGWFEGLDAANPMPLGDREALASVWIGTATRVAAHNDFPHNLAVCAVGQRCFTLFPPDQFANLYLGPLANTPAGRAVSMVDPDAPDPLRHPGYASALAHAQVADLAPGDALFIPSGWYHAVDATAPFNVLVNYWWRDTPRWLGQPQDALIHAILAIRDLPEAERQQWRALFEHHVFSGGEAARAHLPPAGQGILAPLDATAAGRIRAFLLRSLSR
ncbi:cupin [Novosphingobium pokkalii]|nr:cupin [Novosphingobium pokkalii]